MTHAEAAALAVACLLTLAVVAVRAVLAMRGRKPGTHRETPPDEWTVADLKALAEPPRVVHAGRPARWPGPPAATLALPAYSQTVPRAPVASLPPWPVQPTLTEGGRPWHYPPTAAARTAPSAPATAISGATTPATPSAPASRTSPTDLAVWTPGRIRVCEVTGCPGRQSHDTAGHDRWIAMVGVLFLADIAARLPAARTAPAFPEPASTATEGLHWAIVRDLADAGYPPHVGAECVDSIFMQAVAGDV